MSDFFSAGWGYFIAAISLIGIAWCLWLLWSQRKTTVQLKPDGSVDDTTGHVWDGDLRELNNPLPRWWAWMFILACVFGLAYLVLYPGLGTYKGTLQYTTRDALAKQQAEVEASVRPLYAKYMQMDVPAIAKDSQAREIGQRLFLNYCAQCHGSDAGGSKGFPNLTDGDWLYGGEPDVITQSILKGRNGIMPPFAAQLDGSKAGDVAQYVRSLSGLPADPIRVARGEPLYKANCVACHGAGGKGNQALGAPNLSDRTWLYGSSERTIVETILKGRNNMMPAHEEILTPEKVRMISAYVWGLSNGAAR